MDYRIQISDTRFILLKSLLQFKKQANAMLTLLLNTCPQCNVFLGVLSVHAVAFFSRSPNIMPYPLLIAPQRLDLSIVCLASPSLSAWVRITVQQKMQVVTTCMYVHTYILMYAHFES